LGGFEAVWDIYDLFCWWNKLYKYVLSLSESPADGIWLFLTLAMSQEDLLRQSYVQWLEKSNLMGPFLALGCISNSHHHSIQANAVPK
jgi:hypothetical protein